MVFLTSDKWIALQFIYCFRPNKVRFGLNIAEWTWEESISAEVSWKCQRVQRPIEKEIWAIFCTEKQEQQITLKMVRRHLSMLSSSAST